jgi:HlyD family secretion protein
VKRLLLYLLCVGAALGGMAYWLSNPRGLTVTEKTFTYATVDKGTMVEAVSATGILEPREIVIVGSELPGKVVALPAQINDTVAEGDILLQLDDKKEELKREEAENGVQTAKAALAQADAMHLAAERALKYQQEIEKKGGFRAEREQAEGQEKAARAGVAFAAAKLKAAQTAAKEAQNAWERTKVRVPSRQNSSPGAKRPYLVLERKVQLGQMVGPAAGPLFTLAGDLHTIEVHAQVAEGDVGKVKKGLTASFTVTAFSDADIEFTGMVKEIRPMPANVKGAVFYATVIEVRNQKDPETGEWRLRPGMTAAVDIIRRQHANVWKMPTAALTFQLEDDYQSDAARARVDEWKKRPDAGAWRPVWVWDSQRREPWPLFVRVGGTRNGEPGLKDSEFNEVLEWEPGVEPSLAAPPRVITHAPPARSKGFFDQPSNIKVS